MNPNIRCVLSDQIIDEKYISPWRTEIVTPIRFSWTCYRLVDLANPYPCCRSPLCISIRFEGKWPAYMKYNYVKTFHLLVILHM
jgi:hypothetical protein